MRKFGTWIKSYALPSLARLTATCSSLRVLDRPPARSLTRSLSHPLPGAAADRCCMLILGGGGGGGGERSGRMLALGLRCSLVAAQLLPPKQEL